MIWQRTLASQMADATGPRSRPHRRHLHATAPTASSPPAGTTITFAGYRAGVRRVTDDDDGAGTTEALLPPLAGGEIVPSTRSPRRATAPRRPPATPRPRSSSDWRSSASAGRPRGPRSSRPCRTVATCGRRARRSCPPGPRSPSSGCSRSTSTTSSTTSSPPRSRKTSTRSPARAAEGPVAAALLLRRRCGARPGSSAWSRRTSTRSMPPSINTFPLGTRPRTAPRSSSSPASTGPTSSAATTPPASPTTWRPTS